ncbi:hypothetical protein [Microbulbifer sp. TYP-18]|uniref:hypothetical protein n=1 Tax=Microbulbifer sp. TYP-18 TaxID=3230024 RepID=UPI0034C6302D
MLWKFLQKLVSGRSVDVNQVDQLLSIKRKAKDRSWDTALGHNTVLARIGVFHLQMLLFLCLGILPCLAFVFEEPLTAMVLNYTIVLSVLGFVLFSHFTSVFSDVSDRHILAAMPVNSPTLSLAKLMHALQYSLAMTCSLNLFSAVFVAYSYGALALLGFMVSQVLIIALLLTPVFCLLALASHLISPGRIRTLLFYTLILASAFCLVALNLYVDGFFSENFDAAELTSAQINGNWLLFYPPAWLAGLIAWISQGDNTLTGTLATLAVVVPPIIVGLSYCLFSRRYEIMLEKLALAQEAEQKSWVNQRLYAYLARRFFKRKPESKGIFMLVTKLMSTDFGFKLRVYPQLGIVLAFALLFLYDKFHFSVQTLSGSFALFLFIYALSCFMVTTIANIQYGDRHQAAWVYQSLPLGDKWDEIVKASLLAFVFHIVVPTCILLVFICALGWGSAFLLDVLCATLVAFLGCSLQGLRFRKMPFSQDMNSVTRPLPLVLDYYLVVIPIGFFAVGHYLMAFYLGNLGLVVYSVIVAALTIFTWKRLLKSKMDDPTSGDRHLSWSGTAQ